MTWDDFYAECSNLPEDMVLRCISRIKKFGDTDDVVDAILSVSYPADDALYERAVPFSLNILVRKKYRGLGIAEPKFKYMRVSSRCK